MQMDKIYVLMVPQETGGDDAACAFTSEADARATLRTYHETVSRKVRIEECSLAPSTSAGIAADRQEGRAEAQHALDDLHRVLMRHNVAGCGVALNQYAGMSRIHFPTWSTIQATDKGIEVGVLDASDPKRWRDSFDLLQKLAQALAMQAKGLVGLVKDVASRTDAAPRIQVVPGLPGGLRR